MEESLSKKKRLRVGMFDLQREGYSSHRDDKHRALLRHDSRQWTGCLLLLPLECLMRSAESGIFTSLECIPFAVICRSWFLFPVWKFLLDQWSYRNLEELDGRSPCMIPAGLIPASRFFM